MALFKLLIPFREIMEKLPWIEMHVHTNQTDGCSDINELLKTAVNKKIKHLAITEHVRKNSTWFLTFARTVKEAAKSYDNLIVYVGCEAKAIDLRGSLDVSNEILAVSDLVLGSVHSFPEIAGRVVDISQLTFKEAAEIECNLALGILENPKVDILAHPGGMVLRRHGHYPDYLYERIIRKAIDYEKAIEINSSYLSDEKEMRLFIDLCVLYNPVVSIGSDVHHKEEIGHCFRRLKNILSRYEN